MSKSKEERCAKALAMLRGHEKNRFYDQRLEECLAEMEAHFEREEAIALARRGTFNADTVHRLWQTTGASMLSCKNALLEEWGDESKAADRVRRQGQV